MSVSEVQIAKLALQHIGDRFDITSLEEASPEAEQVNLVFANIRDGLLREYPWKCALRYTSPSELIGTVPAGWTRMFTYPSTALKVWRIVNPLDPRGELLDPLPFTVARNELDVKVLLTDQESPEFEYTQRTEDVSRFDANLVLALSWRIALAIHRPITGMEPSGGFFQQAEGAVQKAKVEDGNEGISRKQTKDPDWIRARG